MNIDQKLTFCYEVMMKAAGCGFLNARGVRTGYTHWLGPELSKEIQMFSGYVSQKAIQNNTEVGLVLEHFLRIQTELTSLMKKHIEHGENLREFIDEIKRLEKVHIVTKDENNILRKKDISGDYEKAGITLVHWDQVPSESKLFLKKKLNGKVANSSSFF